MQANAGVKAILLFFTLSSTSAAESSMRCGTNLVSVGDSKVNVLLKCGEPLVKESVGAKEESKRIDIPLTSEADRRETRRSAAYRDPAVVSREEVVTKTIEHWTYHQGSGSLLKVLIFEGGELVEISTGERM
ncbi:MAG TPA: DUF2845 domain-containing protein [Gammaproteobacteria bacterium]